VARAHLPPDWCYLVFPLLALGPVRRNPASPGRDGPLVPRWMGAAGAAVIHERVLLLRWPSSDWRLEDAAAEGFMDRQTAHAREGGAGLELHICMHRMVNWAETTPPKVTQQQPDALLAPPAPPAPPAPLAPLALWEHQQCNTPSKFQRFFCRQNSGPPSTSFTIGPRFAEIRA
jgi:hypothetical protein